MKFKLKIWKNEICSKIKISESENKEYNERENGSEITKFTC